MSFNYDEGSGFLVPLRQGGFGFGLVARVRKRKKIALGYFFGPKLKQLRTIQEAGVLAASDAVLVCRFGDLSLIDGSWKILGPMPGFDRRLWPMPLFRRVELTGRTWLVEYSDNDPNRVAKETVVTRDSAERFADDALFGSGAVEIVLTNLLSP